MTLIPFPHTDNIHTGTAQPEPWVLAGPFRAWLGHLVSATGLPWRVIALAAGVSTRTAGRILRGETRKIRACDGQALLAARPADLLALGVTPTPAGSTTERARHLVDAGVPPSRLADVVGLTDRQVAAILDGRTQTVSVLTALAFVALLEVRDATLCTTAAGARAAA